MAITDKTRKILWAKSGNMCAICKVKLTSKDGDIEVADFVLGIECHIISSKNSGPRHRPLLTDYDTYDNLLLLCPNDHRRIDELVKRYPLEKVRQIKNEHEAWVDQHLTKKKIPPKAAPKSEILHRIIKGKQLLNLVDGSDMYRFDYDDLENQEEAERVGDLLQEIQDWGDILDEIGQAERIKIGFELNDKIKTLEEDGLLIFADRSQKRMANTTYGDLGLFEVLTLVIVRKDAPGIINDEEEIVTIIAEQLEGMKK
jgi:hypothetical protein